MKRSVELARLTLTEIDTALERSGFGDNRVASWRDLTCHAVRVDENGANAQAQYTFKFYEGTAVEENGSVFLSVRNGLLYGEY